MTCTLLASEELAGWIELDRTRAILREFCIFLSPDRTKTAVVCLESDEVVSIFNREEKKMEYVSKTLAEGMKLINALLPILDITGGKNVDALKRVAIEALITQGIRCEHCKVYYVDFEDFAQRNPRRGFKSDLFVDAFCWTDYSSIPS